jgi:hypothetical protein
MSPPREMQAGVPQGSVLSPTLFNLYVNDAPQTHGVHLALFADDTCLYATDRSQGQSESHCDWQSVSLSVLVSGPVRGSWPDIYLFLKVTVLSICVSLSDERTDRQEGYVVKKLQRGFSSMEALCERWNVKINEDKILAIYFSRNRRPPESCPTLNGRNIPFVYSAKYLGVIFDRKVTWRLPLLLDWSPNCRDRVHSGSQQGREEVTRGDYTAGGVSDGRRGCRYYFLWCSGGFMYGIPLPPPNFLEAILLGGRRLWGLRLACWVACLQHGLQFL